MDQREYESHLEYRICQEFLGMSDTQLRWLYCDAIQLFAFLLDDAKPRIEGIAWIGNGSHQEEWRCELLLPRQLGSRDEIRWEELMPPENVTCWLAIDRQKKVIQIEPAVAIPDRK